MPLAWLSLLLAGVLEIVWALGLKYSHGLHALLAERRDASSPSR